MFWIFANDKNTSLAPNNSALGATLANGWRNFHEFYLLAYAVRYDSQRSDYTGSTTIRLHFYGHLLWLQDSQDEGGSFGYGDRMFKMRRQ